VAKAPVSILIRFDRISGHSIGEWPPRIGGDQVVEENALIITSNKQSFYDRSIFSVSSGRSEISFSGDTSFVRSVRLRIHTWQSDPPAVMNLFKGMANFEGRKILELSSPDGDLPESFLPSFILVHLPL
jgi:hypothetical protein